MEINICKNCGHTFEDKFCNHCGQKLLTDKDKSFKHLLNEVFHFLTHFEGSFIHTAKAVLFHPGRLSEDYCNGKRKAYYQPISFFLMIVVLYLLFPLAKGMNMEMESYKQNKFSGAFFQQQIEQKLKTNGISETVLTEKFHQISGKTSKILLLLLIPFSAIFIFILFYKQKEYAFDYSIIATEINAFFILFIFTILPLLFFLIALVFRINDQVTDAIIEPFLIAVVFAYIFIVLKRFFKEKPLTITIKSLLFCAAFVYIILPLYQFILFEITFHLLPSN